MRLVEFDSLINGLEYPISKDELIAAYGIEVLEIQNGSESVAQIFDRSQDDAFSGPDDVRLTLYNSLSDTAIGRKAYTDRDPPVQGEINHLSF